MKNNVKNVVKYKTYDKPVISFDEKGRQVIKNRRIKDAYQVFLRNGDVVILTAADLKRYGVQFAVVSEKTTKPVETPVLSETIVEDDVEEEVEEITAEGIEVFSADPDEDLGEEQVI